MVQYRIILIWLLSVALAFGQGTAVVKTDKDGIITEPVAVATFRTANEIPGLADTNTFSGTNTFATAKALRIDMMSEDVPGRYLGSVNAEVNQYDTKHEFSVWGINLQVQGSGIGKVTAGQDSFGFALERGYKNASGTRAHEAYFMTDQSERPLMVVYSERHEVGVTITSGGAIVTAGAPPITDFAESGLRFHFPTLVSPSGLTQGDLADYYIKIVTDQQNFTFSDSFDAVSVSSTQAGTPAIINTFVAHNFLTGQELYISGIAGTFSGGTAVAGQIAGWVTITKVDNDTFTINGVTCSAGGGAAGTATGAGLQSAGTAAAGSIMRRGGYGSLSSITPWVIAPTSMFSPDVTTQIMLEVRSDLPGYDSTVLLSNSLNQGGSTLYFKGDLGEDIFGMGLTASLGDGSPATNGFRLFQQSPLFVDPVIMLANGGNVGIGTFTPAYKLDVNGTFSASGVITLPLGTDSTNKDTGAVILEGGLGVEKEINAGTSVTVNEGGILTAQNLSLGAIITLARNGGTGEVTLQSNAGNIVFIPAGGAVNVIGDLALSGSLNDTGANELIKFTATASAINEVTVANAAVGNAPTISATGGDTDIGLTLASKGAGQITLSAPAGNITLTGTVSTSSTLTLGGAILGSQAATLGAVSGTSFTGGTGSFTTLAATSRTFTLSDISTTALATPSALSATQYTAFASTVSGASIMGFGTTNDVTLRNRAGTVCLGVGPNTTTINIPGFITSTGGYVCGTGNYGFSSSSRWSNKNTAGTQTSGWFQFDSPAAGNLGMILGNATADWPCLVPLGSGGAGRLQVKLASNGTTDAEISMSNAIASGNIIANGATSVIRLKGYTVATLPAGTVGDTAYVTDAEAPAYLAVVASGAGADVITPVFYNGTNWICR